MSDSSDNEEEVISLLSSSSTSRSLLESVFDRMNQSRGSVSGTPPAVDAYEEERRITDERHKQVREINRRTDISHEERQRMVRQVMMGHDSSSRSVATSSIPAPSESTYDDVDALPSCDHYPSKKCRSMFFTCCQTYDACVRCHRENRRCPRKLQPAQISSILCSECGSRQPPAVSCSHCHVRFGKNHCDICKIWTELDIYHCDKCGICRVGSEDQHIHCDTCGTCMSIEHECVANPSQPRARNFRDAQCGFCLENVFDSQTSCRPIHCGHYVHDTCLRHATHNYSGPWTSFRCPLCRKMTMPPEDLAGYWSSMAEAIAGMPLEQVLYPRDNALYYCSFGTFRFLREHTRGDLCDVALFEGELVNWTLADGTAPRVSIKRQDVLHGCKIICIDCELSPRNYVIHRWEGCQCPSCSSFNVTIVEKSPHSVAVCA